MKQCQVPNANCSCLQKTLLRLVTKHTALRRATLRIQCGTFPLKIRWNLSGWINSIVDERTGRELIPAEKDKPIGRVLISRGRDDFRRMRRDRRESARRMALVTRRIEMTRDGSVLPLTVITLYRDGHTPTCASMWTSHACTM